MASRRWPIWGVALIGVLFAVVAGCDSGGSGSSPFRNLGKRDDNVLPASASRPAPR